MEFDPSLQVGETGNARFYLLSPRLIVVAPFPQCVDTQETARASLAVQHDHWRAVGHSGAAVILMDDIVRQERGARAVYAEEPDPELITCFALVGGTRFGRAVATIFLSLRAPPVATRFFAALPEARSWIDDVHGRGGA